MTKQHTLDTASNGPLTFNIRSGFPGMLSDTTTRAPLLSRISLTCAPDLPIIMEASCVTIKHRIWICAVGGEVVVVDADGVAEVVAESDLSPFPRTEVLLLSLEASSLGFSDWFELGVGEALSSLEATGASVILKSGAAVAELGSRASSDGFEAPVFGRLFLCCSLSEGERERFRFESASGIYDDSICGCRAR